MRATSTGLPDAHSVICASNPGKKRNGRGGLIHSTRPYKTPDPTTIHPFNMLRSQATRIAHPARRIASRRFATAPPPPAGQPAPNPEAAVKKDNTLLYTGLGLAGAAGAWYYFSSTDDAAALEKKARQDEQRVKVNARQTVDATKDTAHDAVALGRVKSQQLEVQDEARAKAGEARAHWEATKQDTKQKWDSTKADAEQKWDETKGRLYNATHDVKPEEGRGLFDKAEDGIKRTKEETEAMYRNTRETAERKAEELRREAERKGEDVKRGWFSWLGYGKSKVSDAEDAAKQRRDQLESEADRLKREAARGVANTAEDVRVRAEKHT
ncbi:hypothetical protein NMY22_g126 [Coprinellus aureogranulatus]|nr:hypothetical protein NMY22_g126 [Coprinellus aureogranulatus]